MKLPQSQILLLSIVAIVAAAAGAFLYGRHSAQTPSASSPLATGLPASTASPRAGGAVALPPVPETLPEFSLHDREGNLRSIRSWPGKSLIVNFWATWCAPCRKEIPLLIETQRRNAPDGFQIVGVAVDFRDAVLEYAKQMDIDYPILIGEQDGLDAVNAFGVEAVGFPFTVFTDAQGRIVALHLGELTAPLLKTLMTAVRRVNSGELTPAAARLEIARLAK